MRIKSNFTKTATTQLSKAVKSLKSHDVKKSKSKVNDVTRNIKRFTFDSLIKSHYKLNRNLIEHLFMFPNKGVGVYFQQGKSIDIFQIKLTEFSVNFLFTF